MDKQMDYAVENRIPFVIFIGENEIKENKVKVKCMANSTEIVTSRDTYIEEILKMRTVEELLNVPIKHKEVNVNQKAKVKKENKK